MALQVPIFLKCILTNWTKVLSLVCLHAGGSRQHALIFGIVAVTTGYQVHRQGDHLGNAHGLGHPLLLHGERVGPVPALAHIF